MRAGGAIGEEDEVVEVEVWVEGGGACGMEERDLEATRQAGKGKLREDKAEQEEGAGVGAA